MNHSLLAWWCFSVKSHELLTLFFPQRDFCQGLHKENFTRNANEPLLELRGNNTNEEQHCCCDLTPPAAKRRAVS